jgi:hypothetical protein
MKAVARSSAYTAGSATVYASLHACALEAGRSILVNRERYAGLPVEWARAGLTGCEGERQLWSLTEVVASTELRWKTSPGGSSRPVQAELGGTEGSK